MEGVIGIVESKKVLSDVMVIAIVIAELAKDGVQISDAVALWGNEKLKLAVAELAVSVSKVPAELGDITLVEGIELAMVAVQKVPELIAALKK